MHTNTQIRSLNVRSRDSGEIRSADFGMWDCTDNLAGAVPVVRMQLAVDFSKLAEIHVLPKVLTHRADIGPKLIAGNLIPTICAGAKVGYKLVSTHAIARANVVGDEQLSFAVNRKPEVNTSPFGRIAFVKVRLSRVAE